MNYNFPLNHEIARLEQQLAECEKRCATLAQRNNELEAQVAIELFAHPEDDDFTYEEVMRIIRSRCGKINGGQIAWCRYSMQQSDADPNLPLVTENKIRRWRVANRFPAWAVRQLREMPDVTCRQYRWSDEDIDYLCNLHLGDPRLDDNHLAEMCSQKFGCFIGRNAIKGKFVLLRQLNRIPAKRPRS